MASLATALAEIVQWALLVAADRAVHLLERLHRHSDAPYREQMEPPRQLALWPLLPRQGPQTAG
jgi:hypothetical protein